MQTINDMNNNFFVQCGHCFKKSRTTPKNDILGHTPAEIITRLGMMPVVMSNGTAVMCNRWCAWRFGKKSGIHGFLNRIFGKSDLFKQ